MILYLKSKAHLISRCCVLMDLGMKQQCCIENLFDDVVPGGIIIFDDYLTWEGCRKLSMIFHRVARVQSLYSNLIALFTLFKRINVFSE